MNYNRFEKRFAFFKATSALCSMSNTDGFVPNAQQGGGRGQPQQQQRPQQGSRPGIWSNISSFLRDDNSGRQDNNAPPNNGDQNNPNNQNNIDPKKKMVDDIWSDPPEDPAKKKDNVQQPPNNPQNPDPKDQLKRHLDDVGLGDLTLTEAEIEAFKTGDNVAEVLGKINARIQNSYLKSMSNISTVMDNKIKTAVQQAVDQSSSMFKGERIRDYLQENFAQAKDPVMGPVAETVMRRLLDKGASNADALAGVKEFFTRIDHSMNPDKAKANPNTRTNYRGEPPPGDRQGSPAGESNWLDVLTGNADRR